VEEIMAKVDQEFKKIDRSGMLPAGVVLIGGGAKLADLVDTAKKNLRLPVCLGVNKNVASLTDKVNDLDYLTAVGLAAWGEQAGRGSGQSGPLPWRELSGGVSQAIKKILSIFKP